MLPSSAARRLQRELHQIQRDGGISPTVHVAAHDDDITKLEALIMGPPDTPYDGGLLHFQLRVPPEYPLKPPSMRFMNTDGGTLQIHPQLYAEGKVCLSILGTWHGPKWTASQGLRTLLLSVQSLLNEEPLRCEPGLENAPQHEVDRANVFVVHEATRVLTLGALSKKPTWGCSEAVAPFSLVARRHIAARCGALVAKLSKLATRHDGQAMPDPFRFSAPTLARRYDFASLAQQLQGVLEPSPCPELAAACHDAKAGNVESEEAEFHCRICHLSEEESDKPLITPCDCSGSIRYAHSHCLLSWLQYSGGPVSTEWRCDVCKAILCVRLGGSSTRAGFAFFGRHLDDVLEDQAFEAPGLVAMLLVSLLQVFVTTTGRIAAYALYSSAELVCSLAPARLLAWLAAPAVLVDIATNAFYVLLVSLKATVACAGPRWTPAHWGSLGGEQLGLLFDIMVDNLGLALGLRLNELLILVGYFTGSHLMSLLQGQGPDFEIKRLLPMLFQDQLDHTSAGDRSYIRGVFPIFEALMPDECARLLSLLHWPLSVFSLLLNIFAITALLKRAFLDRRPVPVDVFSATKNGASTAAGASVIAAPASAGRQLEVGSS